MPMVFVHLAIQGPVRQAAGVLVFDEDNGLIVGADAGGLHYDGTYVVERGEIKAKVTVQVPADAALLTDAPPAKEPYSFPLELSIPADDFTMPLRQVKIPNGVVGVHLRLIRRVP